MGHLSAVGMAESGLPLEAAIEWHLRSNHYPPVPVALVPTCVEAIGFASDEDWDAVVSLPDGVKFRGGDTASVWQVVEAFHLDAFIETPEDASEELDW